MDEEVKEMTEGLKPCPFCGENGQYTSSSGGCDEEDEYPVKYNVGCRNCGASSGFYDKKEDAAESWNERTDEPPLLPCPFCRSTCVEILDDGGKTHSYYVACHECGASSCHYKEEPDAVESWNRRVER